MSSKTELFAQALMEESMLNKCGRLVIQLANLPQADSDEEFENEDEERLKALIIEARGLCAEMKHKGMLK